MELLTTLKKKDSVQKAITIEEIADDDEMNEEEFFTFLFTLQTEINAKDLFFHDIRD